MASAKFLVSGLVQGVYFRGSTQARAQALGLGGYAKNLADGRVEVVAEGAPDALAELQRWLHEGPPGAQVERVEREEIAPQAHRGFARL